MVKIKTGPVDRHQNPEDVPPDKWRTLMRAWRSFAQASFSHDCRELARYITKADESEMWRVCGYGSLEEFIHQGLALEPEEVNWAMEGLQLYGMEAPVPLSRAAQVGALREEGMTQQQIADKLNMSQQHVSRLHSKRVKPKSDNARTVYLPKSPQTAAAKIRDKFGDAFADELKRLL